MATKKSSAGGFKQMPKMDTTEPSVILKMAKGGHVNTKQLAKAENGFSPMSSNPKYRESMEAESGNAPKKPSMSARRQAMNPNFKGGGKVVKKSLGGMIAKLAAEAASKAKSMPASSPSSLKGGFGALSGMMPKVIEAIKADSKTPPPVPAPIASKMGMSGLKGAIPKVMPNMRGIFRKDGGSADMSQDKAMIKKAMKQHDAQEHAGGKGTKLSLKTGGVTKGNGGGYKTGGVALGQGGYAKGGIINTEGQGGEYRNTKMHTANTDHSPAKTGDVKLGNGGGYKAGGKASKKAYATGGTVNDEGKAVKMPSRPVSRPVANSLQSGTFKNGGRAKKFDDGGSTSDEKYTVKNPKAVSDKASRELEDALNPFGMVKELAGKAKDYFVPPAGSVTKTEKSVTVTPSKRSGGSARK